MAATVEAEQSGKGRRGRQGRQGADGGWSANARWNFVVLGADVAFFTFALNIASAYVVLPLFVHHLTADNTAVALIIALRALGLYGPQLLVAPLVERRRHALPLILRLTVLERVPYLALAFATVLFADSHPDWLLVFFFVMILLALGGGGLTFPAWLDLIARAMPRNWLGRFLGFWQGLGGFFGIGGAALAAFVLAHVTWPLNFALCFLLTFVAMAISFVLLALGREPPRTLVGEDETPNARELPAADVAQSHSESVRAEPGASLPSGPPSGTPIPAEAEASIRPARMGALWALLREDSNLRRLLITNALGGFATMAAALFAISALKLGGLSTAEAGAEATVLALASAGGYFLW
ncbi:MAG TPA: MFS transporter, partial [Ktedonobacterales bacterium]|nr:MFS transporter [Ktedonobacterales bacterium]